MKFATIVGITLIAAITASSVARAETVFTYQGELNENGNLANGVYNMDFSLWDALAGGSQIGSTFTINNVQVTEGRFTVELDFGANALDNTDRWLEIAVNSATLVPRQPITRTPYSIQTRGLFVDDDQDVGIGVTNPLYPLHVGSDESVTANFDNTLTGPFSTFGVVANVFADDGTAVWGLHASADGAAPAILGETFSSADNASGIRGVVANANPGSSSAAIRGINFGTGDSGIGVWGSHNGNGFGVFGSAPTGIGVYGYSTATSGGAFNEGVRGQADFDFGIGVHGLANGIGGFGVKGESAGTGVQGISTDGGFGVYGLSEQPSGTGWAVFAICNSPQGYDFFAAGAGVDYGSSSSCRWKMNVENIDRPLAKLAELRGVYFDWDSEHGGQHDVGMIAEEVGMVLPEIVQYEENGIDAIGMDYSKMTPLLVEAVNELNNRHQLALRESQRELTDIRNKNLDLRERLSTLESLVQELIVHTKEK